MLVGHYAAGFASKRLAPQVSLGVFFAASLFPDLLVSVTQLLGIEHARVTPGFTAFSSLDAYDVAISHSLATGIVWSVLLGAAYFWRRRDARGSLAVATAVFSHWILDFVSHRPELPLTPGVDRYVGLGLWNSIPMTFMVEGTLWAGAISLYSRATSPVSPGGSVGLLPLIAIPTVGWIRMPFTSLPSGDFTSAALVALLVVQSALCVLAWWVDRQRSARPTRIQ